MSPPAKPTPRRKHVTTACLPCRRSKIKCDGLTPACSNCVTKGSDCRYQMGDDRRKLSLRVAVELLCRRAEQLCHFIEENGMQVPAMPKDDETMLQRTLSAVGVSYDKICTGQHSNSSPTNTNEDAVGVGRADGICTEPDFVFDISRGNINREAHAISESAEVLMPGKELGDHRPTSMDDHEPDFGAPLLPQVSNISQGRVQAVALQLEPLNQDATIFDSYSEHDNGDGDDVEELVDLLSDRMGSLQIGADGQIRYYGPTSNYGLLNMSSTDPLHIHRSIRNDGQEYLDRLDVGAEVPLELEEHLVNLYFTWQDASFRVVDRKMYETGKLEWHKKMRDTPYYSEALRNSICAIGAAFESKHHPDFVTFPKSLGDFFADRAKTLLDIELDSPCVATAQAMVVTSCHDMGCTRDARAWLFSGMAIRLAFDLGLHKDMTFYVEKGIITPSEADLRRTIFWGAYVVDQAWAFYLGRQFKINMEEVTCAKPSGDSNAPESDQWMAYPTSQQQLRNGLMKEISRQRVLLCEIMAPLGYRLYSDSKIVPARLQALNAATVKQLSQWKADLPEALKINLEDRVTPYLPHTLMIHMIYYQSIIYAHRPWMSRTYIQPQPPQGPGSNHARHVCIDAAISIAKILEGYESRYTFRRVNTQGPIITCSAALMLVFANVTQYGRSQGLNIPRYLSICFRALEEFGHSWESAKRARVFLLKLQQQWDNKARARRKLRKNSEIVDMDNDMPNSNTRKGPLTATDFGSSQFDLGSTWTNQQRPLTDLEQQPHGLDQSGDDSVGLDFDTTFDWIMEDNEQLATGRSSSGRPNTAFPFDFMGLLGDTRFS